MCSAETVRGMFRDNFTNQVTEKNTYRKFSPVFFMGKKLSVLVYS